jgi:disulfide bond formation protein DsbB
VNLPSSAADRPIVVARVLNTLGILAIVAVLGSSLYYQFVVGDHPCKLCQLQRVCMIGVALGAAMNLMLGMRVRHYAVSIMFSVSGALAAFRHILINACPYPGEPAGFGPAVLGLHTYTWAFTVFGTAIFASAAILMWGAGVSEADSGCLGTRHWTKPFAVVAVGLVALICVVMTISAFQIAVAGGH